MIPEAHLQAALDLWTEEGERAACTLEGNCMSPLLNDGDALIVEFGARELRCGDVVVFRGQQRLGVHRVVGFVDGPAGRHVVLKGDQCRHPIAPLPRARVIGRVVQATGRHGRLRMDAMLPRLANLLLWLRARLGMWLLGGRPGRLAGARSKLVSASISLIPVLLLCRANRLRSSGAHRGQHGDSAW
jgi:hypothetical protein